MDNVWAATVQKMFDVFGINRPALYDVKVRQYIDEVVDKRNAVAHGRESAAITGQSYTTRDLQKTSFEGHIAAKSFIRVDHQSLY